MRIHSAFFGGSRDPTERLHSFVVVLSILRDVAQALSSQGNDRALRLLVENALAVTESKGAVLLIPREKSRQMMSLIACFSPELSQLSIENQLGDLTFPFFLKEQMVRLSENEAKREDLSFIPQVGPVVFMPVTLASKPIGLFFVFRGSCETEYSPDNLSVLETLTPYMGILMENSRLYTKLIHANSRLSALYDISRKTESLIDLRDAYEALESIVQSFIEYDILMLYLLDSQGETLENRINLKAAPFLNKIKIGEGPIGQAAQNSAPLLTFTDEYKSVLILPLIVSEKLVGVVAIASKKPYSYRDEDIIGLRIITTQIASIDELFKDLLRLRGFTQHILQSMTSGVLIFDNVGRLTMSNPAMDKLLNQPLPEEGLAIPQRGAYPPELETFINEVLETRISVENERILLKNGSIPRTLEVNAFPFRDESQMPLGTAFFFRDITQILRLEEQLKRAERLSALGRLAAGVAHEVRNPLTGIKMIVQILLSEFSPADSKREPLGIILNEIERLEKIIANLLGFARPSKPRVVPIVLADVLETCILLLQNQISKRGLELVRSFPDQDAQITADPDQLKQVFLNILTNAIEASRPKERLLIRIEYLASEAIVSISDGGIGIAKDKIRNIFDPFMTTKEDGTGLGLSIALRIIEDHGGRIEVESNEGIGSTFFVHLARSL